ncbi:MAG: DUF523 domain-containing protein [Candidatus Ozemobacteraceae bacterium]
MNALREPSPGLSGPCRLLVSACLFGLRCPYQGSPGPAWQNGFSTLLPLMQEELRFILFPVCPEQLGGLPTPRPPAELQASSRAILAGEGKVLTNLGDDVTACFLRGAHETLNLAERLKIRGAIFKERSPSCGCGTVYSGSFDGAIINGDGITTALLKKYGIIVRESSAIYSQWMITKSLEMLRNMF